MQCNGNIAPATELPRTPHLSDLAGPARVASTYKGSGFGLRRFGSSRAERDLYENSYLDEEGGVIRSLEAPESGTISAKTNE